MPPFSLEGQFNFLNVSFIGFYRGRPERLAGGELSGCSSLHVEQGGEEDKVCVSLLFLLIFVLYIFFYFLTMIAICLFYWSSLLQGTHTLSPHHRQSARSHTGELLEMFVSKNTLKASCCSLHFELWGKMLFRALTNIVRLAFSPKWLSTGEMLKTCTILQMTNSYPLHATDPWMTGHWTPALLMPGKLSSTSVLTPSNDGKW